MRFRQHHFGVAGGDDVVVFSGPDCCRNVQAHIEAVRAELSACAEPFFAAVGQAAARSAGHDGWLPRGVANQNNIAGCGR